MGRAARECSEPLSALGAVRCYGRGDRVRVDLAAVDPGLEAPADLLARREQRVVVDAAGRKLDDPDRFVAIAVTAGVRSRLVERPQAITISPQPCHTRDTYHVRSAVGTRPVGQAPHFADETLGSGGRTSTSRACTTTGSSRDPTRRSTDGRPWPAQRPSRRVRRGGVRSSPSGTAPGTGRFGQSVWRRDSQCETASAWRQ